MDDCVAETEAMAVQSLLVSRRVGRADPTPFVRVLRMVFDDAYGQFRTLSCPTFGLYKELVVRLCAGEFQFSRAVSRFAVRGRFVFAGMPPGSREKLERDLLAQMAAVRAGEGDDIINGVMQWARIVRLRAVQDIALDRPTTFQRMWMARSAEMWDEVSQDWRVALSTREDRDLGYLPGLWSRPCGDALAKKRASILKMVGEIGDAMATEDEGRWLGGDARAKCSVYQRGRAGEGRSVTSRVPGLPEADRGAMGDDSVTPLAPVIPHAKEDERGGDIVAVSGPVIPPGKEAAREGDSVTHSAEEAVRREYSVPVLDPLIPDADEAARGAESVAPAGPSRTKPRGSTVRRSQTVPTAKRTSSTRDAVLGDGDGPGVRQSVETPKKKLLILDLNGLLLVAIHKSAPQVRVAAHKIVGNFNVYIRAGCEDFVKFCLKHFEVAVWSSGMRDKVSGLVDAAFGKRQKELLFVWAQDKCTITGLKDPTNKRKDVMLKELSVVWADEKGKGFNALNTLLIDDTPYKALRNPWNTAIHPTPWTAEETEDNWLPLLQSWLFGLSTAESVPQYVLRHPIGEVPLRPSSAQWSYFQSLEPHNKYDPGTVVRKGEAGSSRFATPHQVCLTCNTESGPAAPQKVLERKVSMDRSVTSEMHPTSLQEDFEDECVREACFNLLYIVQCYRPIGVIPVEYAKISVRDVYHGLQIETLMVEELSGAEAADVGSRGVTFYPNHKKEVTVAVKEVRALLKGREWLGNNLVDFMLASYWFACSRDQRAGLHIASTWFHNAVDMYGKGEKDASQLGRGYLNISNAVEGAELFEIVVPYCKNNHWSLYIFDRETAYHLDSLGSSGHVLDDDVLRFAKLVHNAWQSLRGVTPYDVHGYVEVPVAQQSGTYECGYSVIRNARIFVEVCCVNLIWSLM